jgi:YebC/PmpR family DNA-binding regulatory protein
MSGHSHWAGIKHKKGAVDAKRGKLFSKLAKYITTAARKSGGDPDSNLKLRYALEKARAASMPKDTIERAVKKGTGELGGAPPDELVYEGYAAGGVAVLVDVLTDNRNRTAGEIRKVFEMRAGALAGAGSVAWMFERKGFITVAAKDLDEESLMEIVLEAGAEDLVRSGEQFEITTKVEHFEKVREALAKAKITTDVAEITQIPSSSVPVTDKAVAKRVLDLMNELEDHEDVQNVYANFDIADDLIEALAE